MRKRIMFLLSLMIVSLVTFSSATYAWFSKQYNPQVDNLSVGIRTQEHMMISKSGLAGTFKDNIAFNELVGNSVVLEPVTGEVKESSIAIYDGNELASENGKYIKFSLYFSGSNDMDVYLEGSQSGTVIDIVPIENSIFTEEQINKMVDSLRIGFLSYSTREIPTSSGTEISYEPFETNVYSVNAKTPDNYKDVDVGTMPYKTFNNIGHTSGILDDVVLLSVAANKVSKLDVYIWLESKDVNCDEGIFNIALKINLRFLAVKVEEADA